MGDTTASLIRIPFDSKFSLILCRWVLPHVRLNVDKGGTLLDDFCVLGVNCNDLPRMSKFWVKVLQSEGFVVSPNSVLEPTKEIKWFGKLLVSAERMGIYNLDGALESALAKWLKFGVAPCTRKWVRSMISRLSWLAQASPFLSLVITGAYTRTWGQRYSKPAPFLLWGIASTKWPKLMLVGYRYLTSQKVNFLLVDAAQQPAMTTSRSSCL